MGLAGQAVALARRRAHSRFAGAWLVDDTSDAPPRAARQLRLARRARLRFHGAPGRAAAVALDESGPCPAGRSQTLGTARRPSRPSGTLCPDVRDHPHGLGDGRHRTHTAQAGSFGYRHSVAHAGPIAATAARGHSQVSRLHSGGACACAPRRRAAAPFRQEEYGAATDDRRSREVKDYLPSGLAAASGLTVAFGLAAASALLACSFSTFACKLASAALSALISLAARFNLRCASAAF